MKVKEFTKWLSEFHDQEADVEVVWHTNAGSYYEQGGVATTVIFDPKLHTTYNDMRGNPYVRQDAPWYGQRTLLLGGINE